MMQRICGVSLLSIGGILVSQTPIHAQADNTPSSVSVERIRTALNEQPPLLRLSASSVETPTFHVEVRGRLFILQPVDEPPFDPTFGLPSVGELMMDGVEKIQSAVVNYKHHHAERRARKEVDETFAAFCASRGGCPTPTTNK